MTSPRFRLLRSCTTALLLGAIALVAAGDETHDTTMTLTDVARIQVALDPAISPDGEHIAYLASIPRNPFDEDDGTPKHELRIIAKDGSERTYVDGMDSIHNIAWTPDGNFITFLGKRTSDDTDVVDNVFAIPFAGGEARQLTHHPRKVREVTFASDSKRFAFIAEEPIPAEIESIRERGFDQEIFEENTSQHRIWIAALGDDASEPRMLDIDATASEIHWSPVADRLLVALQPTPSVDDRYMRRALQVVEIESGATVASFGNIGKLGAAAWNPGGERVAYISAADLNDPLAGRLMSAAASGGEARDVLPKYEGHIRSFAWSSADTLLFIGDRGVQCELGRVGADGTGHSSFHLESQPWNDLDFGNGVATLVGDSPSHPNEVFRWSADETAPVRLTDSNPWLSQRQLAAPRVVRYEARDGLDVEGVLYAPVTGDNPEKADRVPLIMVVHGGPEAHFRNGWLNRYSYPTQTLVSRGFAVFFPNYRGSTGRGVAYSKLDQGDAAGREFDDLVDGIDHLVEIGLVDKDRVGITGGSYGGFASAWGATYYSHRYAASVMFVGISNQLSKSGTTDIFNEMSLVHWLSKPWEKWQFYLERSPIYHVEKARTPLLILHGQKDPRVHPEQSLELYRYVKEYGQAPVRLVLYPNEQHGNRRAAAQFDFSLRLVRWMEHYLHGSRDDAPPPYGLDHERSWTDGAPITDEKNWWH